MYIESQYWEVYGVGSGGDTCRCENLISGGLVEDEMVEDIGNLQHQLIIFLLGCT